MPIYEYHCDACNTVFEEWRRHADDMTEAPCPACRKTAHRLISNTSFVLKGGGWYATEYGNRKEKTSSAAGTDKSAPESAPATKAETAPAETKGADASSGTDKLPAAPAPKAQTAA